MEYKIVDLDKVKAPPKDGSILCADENGKLYLAKIIYPNENDDPNIVCSLLLSEFKGVDYE